MDDLEARIRRVEDRLDIQEMAVRYGLYVDDRDYDAIMGLFAPDGRLRTAAGVVKGEGAEAVRAYFEHHMPDLGPSNHFVNGHVIDFDEIDPDVATGIVGSHAEMARNGVPMITAMRYLDGYRRVDGVWKFQDRTQTYMYFVDVREYADVLGNRLRIRSSSTPQPADWPRTFT
jgi:SnoaL-like domain